MGSSTEAIRRVEQKLGISLPRDYKDLVADDPETTGRWSSTGDYLMLDPLDDLTRQPSWRAAFRAL
ncbi:SMI1/KNR4 family protein SUKH-1 [Streptomyces sp. 3212.3]|uniref:SMI1/KNR4 family protein n=1 Tax=unclassified Streptomyces TaxID=2593676 RepID=UPI0007411A02|nr:SMI1/KNR4 family protein [Streptomyces sp. NRRL F-5122]KUJ37523.1 hypothetical protein ADL25_27900 [Streptomyces sp. NRRL F-5122]REE61528.1 SMI1/KNR4 family protein SUKH-1 [Streptomyces sp. 3212.3]